MKNTIIAKFPKFKTDMLFEFCSDNGIPEHLINYTIYKVLYYDENNSFPSIEYVNIRLAWSLIKVGYRYKCRAWYAIDDDTIMAHTLSYMLDRSFYYFTKAWSK